jgi:hypothetical protein
MGSSMASASVQLWSCVGKNSAQCQRSISGMYTYTNEASFSFIHLNGSERYFIY